MSGLVGVDIAVDAPRVALLRRGSVSLRSRVPDAAVYSFPHVQTPLARDV